MGYKLNLRSIREKNNYSQKDVADILDVDRTVYTKYENGYELMPIKHLLGFSNFFKVSIDYIFGLANTSDISSFNDMIDLQVISLRLKEFRKENKLTQEKLAKILNTNKSVICNYEKGRYLIATPFLYQICHQYHVSADYLLGRINEKPQENKS